MPRPPHNALLTTTWLLLHLSLPLLLLALYQHGATAQNVRFSTINSHIAGGHRQPNHHQPGIYSRHQCEQACLSTKGCMGVDYDITDKSCWFHGAATICHPTQPMIGAEHIKYTSCSHPNGIGLIAGQSGPGGGVSPVPVMGMHVQGGMFIASNSNPAACLASCSLGCFGVDFDSLDRTCWQHRSTAVCTAPMMPKVGSMHYKLSCPASSRALPALPGPSPPVINNHLSVIPPAPTITCGRPSASPIGGRIVGGDTAVPHSWPWQVALRNRKSKSVRCAGSIIAPYFVLTTAHCVDEDVNPNNWMIYTGAHDLLQFEPTRTMFRVARVIIHEGFDVNTFDNDIALLRLTRPITWTRHVSPVCLPPHLSEIPAGTRCTITGWGVSEAGRRPLKQASVPIIAPQTCRRNDWLGAEFTITDRMICAGYAYGGTDSCQGDSGGPLVCFLNNRWVQGGLTSFGRGCGLPQKPGVYTKVSRYISWIQRRTAL